MIEIISINKCIIINILTCTPSRPRADRLHNAEEHCDEGYDYYYEVFDFLFAGVGEEFEVAEGGQHEG